VRDLKILKFESFTLFEDWLVIITATNLKSPERIKIYIDGANFYHGIRNFNKRYRDFFFDFEKLTKIITRDRLLQGISYYIAPYPRSKSEQMFQT